MGPKRGEDISTTINRFFFSFIKGSAIYEILSAVRLNLLQKIQETHHLTAYSLLQINTWQNNKRNFIVKRKLCLLYFEKNYQKKFKKILFANYSYMENFAIFLFKNRWIFKKIYLYSYRISKCLFLFYAFINIYLMQYSLIFMQSDSFSLHKQKKR